MTKQQKNKIKQLKAVIETGKVLMRILP